MTEINSSRIAIILLFAIAFAIIGSYAPVMYASYAPENNSIEVHSFKAQDTTVNSDEHYICFDRTIHQPSSGEVFTQLYFVGDDGTRVEVDSRTMDRYFRNGRREVVRPFDIPKNITAGEYKYLLVVRMELANGRVTRDFTYTSEPFTIRGGRKQELDKPVSC
jgi:hypothetical protein